MSAEQPYKISLNTQALAALFPEGSEPRIALANAVTAEFVRKNLRASEDLVALVDRAKQDVLTAFNGAKTQVIRETMAQLGLQAHHYNYNVVTLSDPAKALLRQSVKDAFDAELRTAIQERIHTLAESLQGTLKHDVAAAVNRILNREITAAVKAKIQAVMESLQ